MSVRARTRLRDVEGDIQGDALKRRYPVHHTRARRHRATFHLFFNARSERVGAFEWRITPPQNTGAAEFAEDKEYPKTNATDT